MSSYEKMLIGDSTPLMEVDDEESSSLNDELITDAEINADFVDLVDHVGKEEFKEIFLNLYDELILIDIENQRYLCEQLLNKISEIYEFEFTPLITFDDETDIKIFFKFISFLEFDYIDFFAKVISGLELDILKKDVNLFLTMNWNTISNLLVTISEKEINSELISNFFRTYNREGTYEFMRSRLDKDKMLVILKVMEGELKNE
jgi:hypothetical protein